MNFPIAANPIGISSVLGGSPPSSPYLSAFSFASDSLPCNFDNTHVTFPCYFSQRLCQMLFRKLLSTRYARRDRYARSKRYDIRFRYSSELFFGMLSGNETFFVISPETRDPRSFVFRRNRQNFHFRQRWLPGRRKHIFGQLIFCVWGKIDLVR